MLYNIYDRERGIDAIFHNKQNTWMNSILINNFK